MIKCHITNVSNNDDFPPVAPWAHMHVTNTQKLCDAFLLTIKECCAPCYADF